MKLQQKIDEVSETLDSADLAYGHGAGDAADESVWIVLQVIGQELIQVLHDAHFDWEKVLNESELSRIDALIEKRISSRKPFAYLVNETWFAGHKFYIDDRALVPRSYLSEWIPELFSPWIEPDKIRSILDLCTGCGCIGISSALAFPQARVLCSDLSKDALDVAKINIDKYSLGERVHLNWGNCFEGIKDKFDLILCNPPYVSDQRMEALPAEYQHEPEMAFRGGQDGLDFIVPLLQQVGNYLTKGGTLIVEAGAASNALEEYFPTIPFTWLSTAYDETVVFIITASEIEAFTTTFSSR